MRIYKTAVTFMLALFVGVANGQRLAGDHNVYGFNGLDLDFEGRDLIVSDERSDNNSFRITSDFDLVIGNTKLLLTPSQKRMVAPFYHASRDLFSIVDDIALNGVDIDEDAVAELADDILYGLQPVLADFVMPEIDVSTDNGHLSVEVDLEDLQAMIADITYEIGDIAGDLADAIPTADVLGAISETVNDVGNLVDELEIARKLMRRNIPELNSLHWF